MEWLDKSLQMSAKSLTFISSITTNTFTMNNATKASQLIYNEVHASMGLHYFKGTNVKCEYLGSRSKVVDFGYQQGRNRHRMLTDHFWRITFGNGETRIVDEDRIEQYVCPVDGKTYVACSLGKQEYPNDECYDMGDGRFLEFKFQ